METANEDTEAMMTAMGMAAFASTKVSLSTISLSLSFPIFLKGKHVTGNQEGAANVKKSRTWRQYMNRSVSFLFSCNRSYVSRRGGFNRPLDKIR